NSGITTDSNGYAVLPYVSEYKENRIALDTNSFSNNIEIDNAVKSVVPTRGAISAITFEPSVGIKAITTLTHKGKPVPFGAIVDSGNNTGIVADEGKVYLTGLSPSGQLKVNWGSKKE
ncbi:fimbria/pilus outer membrane usher protein, partial [Staphylococcus sp. KY49P]|nr:fimbria/pilus outer membrane usher protein [Staphylococcus sp. KY49P]